MADKLTRAERRELERLRLLVERQREQIERMSANILPTIRENSRLRVAFSELRDTLQWAVETP